MELQWPLIIFTTLVAWSAGLFATQCALALKGEGAKVQMSAWITSAVLLVVGGVAVFFHLEHWERIFNGFGHLTSGITQELIAIVVLAVVAVIYLVFLRKSEDGKMPAWICIVGIAVAAILVLVMAHSYVMAARPAWNTFTWLLCVLGGACGLGPATMALLAVFTDKESGVSVLLGKLCLGGAVANAVGTVAYLIGAFVAQSSFALSGYYFNPNHSNAGIIDVTSFSPFAEGSVLLTVVAIICVALPVVFGFLGCKDSSKWKVWSAASVVAAFVAAICIRVVFYNMGASVFPIF